MSGHLPDLEEGRRLRDEGVHLVENATAVQDWRTRAEARLRYLADWGGEFTADDVVEKCGLPPSPNALGALFLGARRRGLITPVGYAQATRPASHGRIQKVWVHA